MRSDAASRTPRVLIVEGNPANLALTRATLHRAGYETVAARSAEEALDILARLTLDAILLEIRLPGQDGLALARRLKGTEATAAVPLIALTARAMPEDQTQALAAGCDASLAKPINVATFAAEVSAILARHARPGLSLPAGPKQDRPWVPQTSGQPSPSVPHGVAPPAAPHRILVIDDSAENVALLRAQLERVGYRVLSASTGQAGLDAAFAQRPDLILLDVMMPGINGHEVCRRLKADPATQAIPVLMLTALQAQGDKVAGLDVGADDFLTKPVDYAELMARVHSALRMKDLFDDLARSRDAIKEQAEQLAGERSRIESIVFSMSDAVLTTDLEGRITLLNPAAEATLGLPAAQCLGRVWHHTLDLRGPAAERLRQGDAHATSYAAAGRALSERRHTLLCVRADGQEVTVSLTLAPIRRPGGDVAGTVVVFRDITEQTRTERRQAAQHAVARLLARAARVRITLPRVLQTVCRTLGWDGGAYWELDEASGTLQCRHSWAAPAIQASEFRRAVAGTPPQRGAWTVGQVWQHDRPEWIEDVRHETRFTRQALVADAGIRSAVLVPLYADGERCGVMECFGRTPRPRDESMLALLATIGSQTAQFVRRRRAEAALQRAKDGLEARVATRTRELQELNAQLAAELDARRTAEGSLRDANARLETALADRSERDRVIHEQAERMALVNEFARLVSSTLDLDSIFAVCVQQLQPVLESQWCSALRYDRASGALRVAAVSAGSGRPAAEGAGPALHVGHAFPGDFPAAQVLAAGAPHVVQDAVEAQIEGLREVMRAHGVRSLACVPITIDGAGWGLLCVGFAAAGGARPDRVAFLSAIATHLGVAIKNAQLYGELGAALDELRATQSQVVQQERLRALGEMASGIAHDFNNALAPVLGFSELLLTRSGDLADPDRVRSSLQLIHQGAHDAASVVQRLREFYRPRDEDEVLHPVQLDALADEAVSLSQPKWKDQALARGSTITVQRDVGAVPPVAGDAAELREALINLIFNAIDAMPHGGTLSIRVALEGPHVAVAVQDSGAGMSDEVRRRCLEPFFTTKGDRGTGLGLAMVHGTVRRHQGSIDIASVRDEGTTVTLRLPVFAQRQPPAAPTTTAAPLRSLRILVADDDSRARTATGALLEADGHVVDLAANGREALAKLQDEDFDVLVTDRAMPDLRGDELAGLIKSRAPAMPVILLTGFGDLMLATGERVPHVDAIVGKPVSLIELRRAIAEALTAGEGQR